MILTACLLLNAYLVAAKFRGQKAKKEEEVSETEMTEVVLQTET